MKEAWLLSISEFTHAYFLIYISYIYWPPFYPFFNVFHDMIILLGQNSFGFWLCNWCIKQIARIACPKVLNIKSAPSYFYLLLWFLFYCYCFYSHVFIDFINALGSELERRKKRKRSKRKEREKRYFYFARGPNLLSNILSHPFPTVNLCIISFNG